MFLMLCLLPLILILLVPKKSKPIILIVGDSLSYPYGIRPQESWVYLLQERLKKDNTNYKVVNYSVPGDITAKALGRFIWALNEYNPTITIIELGANDGIQYVPKNTIKSNLLKMIVLAKKKNSKVLLLGMRLPVHYPPSYRSAFSNLYQELANQQQVILVPVLLDHVDTNKHLMQEDNLHPTEQGQAIILNNVWRKLKKLL
jgi:acyl-CoA thioesterase-1